MMEGASAFSDIKTTVIRKLSLGFYFRGTSHMRSFVKIKSSQNGEINLSISDIGKSYIIAKFFDRKFVFYRYSRK